MLKSINSLKLTSAIIYICTFFAPFLMLSVTSEMFEIPKIVFIFLCTLLCIVLCYYTYLKYNLKIQFTKIHILLGAFLVLNILSTLTSIDKQTSLNGYYGRINGGVFSLIYWFALFVVTAQLANKKFKIIFINITIICAVILVLIALPGRFLKFDTLCLYFRGEFTKACWSNDFHPELRSFSTLGQPNWLATYLVFALTLCADKFVKNLNKKILSKNNLFYLLTICIITGGILMTGSKSGLLGGLISASILALLYFTKNFKPKNTAILFSVFALLCVAIFTWQTLKTSRSAFNSNITDSAFIRTLVWGGALKSITKSPFLGTGPETFAFIYPLFKSQIHNQTSEKDFIYNKAHNEVLNIASNVGMPAAIIYILIFVAASVALHKKGENGLIAAIWAVFVCNFFGFSTSTTQLLTILTFAIAATPTNIPDLNPVKLNLIKRTSLFFVLLVCTSAFISNMYFLQADIFYEFANVARSNDDPIAASAFYGQALQTKFNILYVQKLSDSSAVAALSLYELSKSGNQTEAKLGQRFESYANIAKKLTPLLVTGQPNNVSVYKTAAKNYFYLSQIYKEDFSYKVKYNLMLQKAKLLAPQDQTIDELQKNIKEN